VHSRVVWGKEGPVLEGRFPDRVPEGLPVAAQGHHEDPYHPGRAPRM